MKVLIIFSVLVGVAFAEYANHYHDHDHYAKPLYKYSYGVNDKHTGDHKSAYESRDGDVTKGSYSVLQPDGVLRTVNYIADKGGFKAEVLNKGVAHHAPVYGKGHGGHSLGKGHGYAVSHHGYAPAPGFDGGDFGFAGAGEFGPY